MSLYERSGKRASFNLLEVGEHDSHEILSLSHIFLFPAKFDFREAVKNVVKPRGNFKNPSTVQSLNSQDLPQKNAGFLLLNLGGTSSPIKKRTKIVEIFITSVKLWFDLGCV